MFRTIGRTWNLGKLSWSVLMQDKELLLFPVFGLISAAIVLAIFASIAYATGSFDRLDAAMNDSTGSTAESVNVLDVVLYVLGAVAVAYCVIFFNAALVAAALERLRGGDPNVQTGIAAVLPHALNILGWAIISASVGLILQALRSRTDNILGRIALSIAGGVWAYMTFFVVPILVAQGIGPIDAIKHSSSLFKRTWGEQVASNFGFGIFYVLAFVIVAIPIVLIFALNPVAGLIVGIALVTLALGTVQAIEGIFKAALYEYAHDGQVPQAFATADLANSYRPDGGRRGW
ncbi:MAG: DUF6159 family protein [Dehalococcoidia bacterium]